MLMLAHPILLQKKYARIIAAYALKYHVTEAQAMNKWYHSNTYQLVREGVADLHCMSDEYLVEELHDEDLAI